MSGSGYLVEVFIGSLFRYQAQLILESCDDGTISGVVVFFAEQGADLEFLKSLDLVISAVCLSGYLAIEEFVIVILDRL